MKTFTILSLAILLFTFTSCKKDNTVLQKHFSGESISAKGGGGYTVNLTQGLIAYYPFNGNANDVSGNGNHGTVNGATLTKDRNGRKNSAYYFDGLSNNIKCINPGPAGNPNCSVSFWIKAVHKESTSQIIGWGNEGDYYPNQSGKSFRILMRGNDYPDLIVFDTYDNASGYLTSFINGWDNYVIIYNGSLGDDITIVRIYKNGVVLDQNIWVQNLTTTNIGTMHPITFGKFHGTVQNLYFEGGLDEIRIYNRVLNQTEINYLASH